MSFVVDGPEPMLWGGELLLRDGSPVGQVTSAAWGETVGGCVGLGYVADPAGGTSRDWVTAGSYAVNVGGAVHPVTVGLRPPYDRTTCGCGAEPERSGRGDRVLGQERHRGLRDVGPPWSTTSEWPRPKISVISVGPGLRACRRYDAFATGHGTVWSASPEMISSGPRSGWSVSTLASVPGWRFAVAAWNSGRPARGRRSARRARPTPPPAPRCRTRSGTAGG